ncbi:uncharacterized protein [Chironomus tepperi]|uniref:uncharacterized protein n=1 Tax=Chironomus tepperi TaxID=113505 RepID=UPI00391F7028
MNVNILIIFCGILWMHGCTNAQSADCGYGIRYYRTTGYIKQSKSYYSCYLSTKLQSSINTVTTINGQHKSGHTDDDVRFLYISNGSSINTFSSIYCQKFKNLEVVQSYAAFINSIDGNSLEKCENLDVLSLKGAQLNSIPNELLTRNSKLSKIWIIDSQVTTLPENLFSFQNKLKLLSLDGNQINFLPSNIFNPLTQLEYLDLHNNKLQSIDSKWFKNLHNVKELFLSENQISVVPDKSFVFLIYLEVLGLAKNRIKFNSDSFVGLHNLKELYISNNEISELPQDTFEPLRNLELLSMYSNKITTIDATSFGVHKNLVEISLRNNKINQIDEKFIDNTAVIRIFMKDNICSNEELTGITNIKVGLKTCFENYETTKTQHEVVRTYQCGQPLRGVGTIIGGRFVARGNFPWVSVLSRPSGDLFCGGTLVSSRKVVTAAHCIQDKELETPTLAREIIVRLGTYDLDKKVEVGRASHAVQSINMHPDWNTLTESYDADIAVLVLDTEVTFGGYIQPICLVRASSASTGVVVGYGKSEDGSKDHENIPKIIQTPIHSNEDCFLNNYLLAKLSSRRTFCGGTGTGSGVCIGDSGNGLFVTDGTTYYLRGIVSASLLNVNHECDVNNYSVFTDVTKYIDWISNVSTSLFDSQCINSNYFKLEQKVNNLEAESSALSSEQLKEKLEKLENEVKNSKFPNFFQSKLQGIRADQAKKAQEEATTATTTTEPPTATTTTTPAATIESSKFETCSALESKVDKISENLTYLMTLATNGTDTQQCAALKDDLRNRNEDIDTKLEILDENVQNTKTAMLREIQNIKNAATIDHAGLLSSLRFRTDKIEKAMKEQDRKFDELDQKLSKIMKDHISSFLESMINKHRWTEHNVTRPSKAPINNAFKDVNAPNCQAVAINRVSFRRQLTHDPMNEKIYKIMIGNAKQIYVIACISVFVVVILSFEVFLCLLSVFVLFTDGKDRCYLAVLNQFLIPKMNVNILIVFCGILWIQSCVGARSADCGYSIRYYRTTGYIKQNKSYYSCYLSTKLQSSINTVTTINGQHKSGHTDDDVRFLYISNGSSINTFSSIFCQKFKNLEVVQTYAASINSIDGNSLEKCENLDVLSLKGAQLNSIPNELLTRNSKLSKIWIIDSQVTTLPENLFSSQNKLKLLSLDGNQINFLPSNIFNPLTQLEYLDLHNNKLQSIDSKWFKNLHNVKELFLSENQISVVPDKSFEFLIYLEVLGLAKNRIKFNSDSFVGLHNLKELYISNNEISELPQNTFEPLRNLELLSMFSNKLTTIDAASFGVHKNLVEISLRNNKINQIDEKFIDNTAVNRIFMKDNICSNEELTGITNIKAGLKTCFENYETTKTQHEVVRTYQCGQPLRGVGTIIGGKYAKRGNFPWVAVLSRPSGDLFCGGTLVSSRKVVTAAHCIQDKDLETPTLAREIIVRLGTYDLDRRIEVGRISHAVQSVNMHPDWNTLTESYDADIAVLVLDTEVTFGGYIQPICLVRASFASTGVVVGYGKSEDGSKDHENVPKIIQTPIHSNEDCFLNNYLLAKLSSRRTFCGGTGTGSGVCIGDSGNGLFVTDGTTYYLRGIVSASLLNVNRECDVDNYSVFTDVTKYIDWINNVSTSLFD